MNLNLRLKIIEKFQTQADFAQAIGADESIISRVIRGRRQLPAEKQAVWADALDCKVQEIFGDVA